MGADWSDLLPEIVNTIAKEIKIYEDFINFMDVCSSWRCGILEDKSFNCPSPLASRFPCLMLAESSSSEEEKEDGYRKFFLLSNGFGDTQKVKFPEARNQRCVSSRGWLLFVLEDEFSTKLAHPHSRIQIELPSLLTFPEFEEHNDAFKKRHCIRKVVLTSSDPFSDSLFRVFVIWGCTGRLGFCNPVDGFWTDVADGWYGQIYDFTYHHGRRQLYAINSRAKIQAYDIDSSSKQPALHRIAFLPREFCDFWSHNVYLLVWDYDKLLVVIRHVDYEEDEQVREDVYRTKAFHVFVVDLRNGGWSKLESLGNRAIFLGYNSSFYFDASDDDDDGCTVKANCIYFTDDCYEFYFSKTKGGGRDMGVYHLSDATIEPHLQQESVCGVSPPLWLEPSYMTD